MSLMDEILADFLPTPMKDFFGDSATYTHKAGGSQTITVIPTKPNPLDDTWATVHMFFDVVTADLTTAPAPGDTVLYKGTTFQIVQVESDALFSTLVGRK